MTPSLHESFSKVQGRKSLIFQTYVTFSIIIFSKYLYNDYLLPNVIDSFVILVNKGNFSRPEPTCFSSLLFMFLWILFLTKYDKIMS